MWGWSGIRKPQLAHFPSLPPTCDHCLRTHPGNEGRIPPPAPSLLGDRVSPSDQSTKQGQGL